MAATKVLLAIVLLTLPISVFAANGCNSTATIPSDSVTLNFADAGVAWPTNTYTTQVFNNVDGETNRLSVSMSDASTMTLAFESSGVTQNGDTAPFFITSGFGTGSSTFTIDFSFSPSDFVDLCVYHINLRGGGDKVQLSAVTDQGTVLTNPTFSTPSSPSYVINGNTADAINFNSSGGVLGAYFQAPGTERITQVKILWSEASNATKGRHGIGFGQISFRGPSLKGVVFEDINYGGGTGRDQTTASGVGVNGATVELYDSAGIFVSSTTTAQVNGIDGSYRLGVLANTSYFVRVVNDTVSSTRTGSDSSELGVQTFRTNGTTAVINEVGGHSPGSVDGSSYSATSPSRLNTTSGVFSGGALNRRQAQSLQPITVSNTDITGVDFGFNFDTIVNANDSGQGSLRQFILNANNLGNTGLNQALNATLSSDYTAGDEVSIFMIPAAALSGNVATINLGQSGLNNS